MREENDELEELIRKIANAEAKQQREMEEENRQTNPASALGAWMIVAAMIWCGATAMALVLWFL